MFNKQICIVTSALFALVVNMPAQAAYVYKKDLVSRHLDLSVAYNYTPSINGFLQVPAGGSPGTSSHHRPTLDEVGIEDTEFYTLALRYMWDPYFVYVGYEYLRPSGHQVLTQDLVTHGQTITAGTDLKVDAQLDWYKIGVGYNWGFILDQLNFFAMLEEAIWRFDYQFSTNSISDGRDFNQATTRFGLGMHYDITSRFGFGLRAASSLPIGDVKFSDIGARFDYKLFNSKEISFAPYFGVSYQKMNFSDDQSLPNHIDVEMNPIYSLGFKVSM